MVEASATQPDPREDVSLAKEAQTDDGPAEPPNRGGERLSTNALTVWAALTLGFLAYLSFGSVRIHQWRWSLILAKPLEDIESVRLLDIWTHQASKLPQGDVASVMTGTYYVALIVFVVACIVATWLLLSQATERTQSDTGRTSEALPEA